MNTKSKPTKAENKAINVALSEHATLIERIEWDGKGDDFTFKLTLTDATETTGNDLQALIAEALEHAQDEMPEAVEAGEQADEAEAEQDKVAKTIVPTRYRNEYKARGDARGCGDWLMLQMRNLLNGGSKKAPVDLVKTYQLAEANGVSKRWETLNPGQQRMNAGNGIRRNVRKNGHLNVPAELSATGEALQLDAMDWVREQEAAEKAKAAAKA